MYSFSMQVVDSDDIRIFSAVEKNVGQYIWFIFEEVLIEMDCSIIVKNGGIKNLCFYQILKHMATVRKFWHVTDFTVRHLADGMEMMNLRECYRNAKFW